MEENCWKDYIEKILAKQGIKLLNSKNNHQLFKGYYGEIDLPDYEEILPELDSHMKISEELFGKLKKSTKLIEITDLKRMGWLVCSIPAYYPFKFYRAQKRFFYLRNENSLGRRNETIHTILPKGLVIKMDLRKKMIRLEGIDAGPRGIGPWVRI